MIYLIVSVQRYRNIKNEIKRQNKNQQMIKTKNSRREVTAYETQ